MTESASELEQRLRQSYAQHAALAEHYRSANRILSLVHYFTSLVEDPRRDPIPFREVLAEGFRLHYVEPPIDSFEALAAWVAGPLSSVVASTHAISDLVATRLHDSEYSATLAMHSVALFPDGSGIESRNTQAWTIVDDGSERFARIRQITIQRIDMRRF